jgi:hypothetical protein
MVTMSDRNFLQCVVIADHASTLVQDYELSLPDLAARLGAELSGTPRYVAAIEGLFPGIQGSALSASTRYAIGVPDA